MTPDEAKRQQDMEQSLAAAGDIIPRLWRQIYLGCVDHGFNPSEAFKLTQTYILASSNQNGIQPPNWSPESPGQDE